MLGMPSIRGSKAIASRRARAKRLELTFDDVVRVAAGDHGQVQADLGVEGKRLHDVPGQRAWNTECWLRSPATPWEPPISTYSCPAGSPVCTQ